MNQPQAEGFVPYVTIENISIMEHFVLQDEKILDNILNARKVRENFMNLFIIGNGFDLYHGLPTQYKHFVEYMKKNFPQEYEWLYDSIKRYSLEYWDVIGKGNDEIIWSDMENVLGSFEALELLEEHRDWNLPKGYTGPPSKEIQNLLNFGFNVSQYLNGWLEELEPYIRKNTAKAWLVNLFKKDDHSILSFNYTMTIEQIYHLPVFHVHGKKGGKLIMGHGNGDGGNIIGEDFGNNVTNQKYIRKYFRETYKNPRRIMKKYSNFFVGNNLKRIKKVYVLGHSLNYIDMPYIESICCHMDSKVKWEIAYYNEDDKIYFQDIMKGILKKNADYELMSWRNFEDRYNLQ